MTAAENYRRWTRFFVTFENSIDFNVFSRLQEKLASRSQLIFLESFGSEMYKAINKGYLMKFRHLNFYMYNLNFPKSLKNRFPIDVNGDVDENFKK